MHPYSSQVIDTTDNKGFVHRIWHWSAKTLPALISLATFQHVDLSPPKAYKIKVEEN
jgi:hypothetical protein